MAAAAITAPDKLFRGECCEQAKLTEIVLQDSDDDDGAQHVSESDCNYARFVNIVAHKGSCSAHTAA